MARTIGLLFPVLDKEPFKEVEEVKETKKETKKKKSNKEKED